MTLFISKPIMWNTEGYQRPSGVKVSTNAFPGEHGFGHEEWNGSEVLSFEEEGARYHVFHTEGVGNAPVDEEAGRTFLFLYASHDGVQELVGVAGNATCLISNNARRKEIARKLELEKLGDQAWAIPGVKALYHDNRSKFDETWQANAAWIPTWICPADMFLWLDKPARLNAQVIRQTPKLISIFSAHTVIDESEALRMLDAVPVRSRAKAWHLIRAEIQGSQQSLPRDLLEIQSREEIKPSVRTALVNARIGITYKIFRTFSG